MERLRAHSRDRRRAGWHDQACEGRERLHSLRPEPRQDRVVRTEAYVEALSTQAGGSPGIWRGSAYSDSDRRCLGLLRWPCDDGSRDSRIGRCSRGGPPRPHFTIFTSGSWVSSRWCRVSRSTDPLSGTDGRKWAVVLTHDVEHVPGYRRVRDLMALERERGLRSALVLRSRAGLRCRGLPPRGAPGRWVRGCRPRPQARRSRPDTRGVEFENRCDSCVRGRMGRCRLHGQAHSAAGSRFVDWAWTQRLFVFGRPRYEPQSGGWCRDCRSSSAMWSNCRSRCRWSGSHGLRSARATRRHGLAREERS